MQAETTPGGGDSGVWLPAPPPEGPGQTLFFGPAVQYSGWWRRVGAWVIDALLVGVTTNIALAIVGGSGSAAVAAAFAVIILVGTAAYYIVLNADGNQTIGRMALGIRVVREGGGDLSYGLSALRFLATTLSWAVALLGILWPLWDDKAQTFHDKVALTVVIKEPSA